MIEADINFFHPNGKPMVCGKPIFDNTKPRPKKILYVYSNGHYQGYVDAYSDNPVLVEDYTEWMWSQFLKFCQTGRYTNA